MNFTAIGDSVMGFDPENHRYYLNGIEVPSVTRVLNGGRQTYYTAGAAARGTAIHAMTVEMDEGRPVTDPSFLEYEPWLNAWEKFKKDYGYVHGAAEVVGYGGGKNKYAGTIDRLCLVTPPGGKQGRCLLDIKTGGVSPDYPVQVSAYGKMRTALPDEEIVWTMLVFIAKTGRYTVEIVDRAKQAVCFADFTRRLGAMNE